jgi:hippurate hydrolase
MVDYVIKQRRTLHEIPELGFDLPRTSQYIYNELVSMGYQPIQMAHTGWVIEKKGISSESILFRTDMDALPVEEKTEVSFASKHKGKMHACGHDGHMAMMLGFARYLSSCPPLKKGVVMIFQPAEEGPGGAKVMIEEGLFDRYDIQAVFGIHLYPGLEECIYALVDGAMLAQNGEFDLVIEGRSAHGAQPEAGRDAILAAAQLIEAYQSVISRRISPLEPAVITIGTIQGGEARNIIAQRVAISGTMRAFSDETYQKMKEEIKRIDQGIAFTHDVIIHHNIMDYYPAVTNDHHLFTQLINILPKKSFQLIKPMTFSEDFAFYQQHVPGVFVMLGTRNEKKGYIHPLHSCYFQFDESVLIKGVELYQDILHMMDAI